MSRFVIRNAAGLFYTGNDVPETVFVPRANDPTRADPVAKLKPLFEAVLVTDAIKYESAGDARDMLIHPHLADVAAFAGCVVCEAELDRHDPKAVVPIT